MDGSAGTSEASTTAVLGNRYEIGSLLGHGGMADVFRATDTLLDRPVAVKILRENTPDGSDRARFTAEARTLAQLSHTGLVMVLDAGITTTTSSDRPFLVMELIEGPTLAAAIAQGPLDLERVGAIGVQLAEALAYAHDQGVVHRDVKPGNVLLGVDQRVKLADFGIARLIGDTGHHTRTGQAIGTAAYLSPEQVTGSAVEGPADVYSLGLVLLEALTGVRAYPGTPIEAAMARLSRKPDVPADLPPAWRELLESTTALDPADRPSAATVAACLRTQPTALIPLAAIRDVPAQPTVRAPLGPPPSGPPPSAPPSWIDRLRALPPHQVGVAAALAALVLLIVVAALAAGGGDAPRERELPPNTPSQLEQPLSDLHDAVEG